MKTVRCFAALAAVLFLASCGRSAVRIEGVMENTPEEDLIVRLLDVNNFHTLDTIKTDANGKFAYELNVAEGKPEFIYLFHDDAKVASLLVGKGERIKLVIDENGDYSVEGSPESEMLRNVDKDYSDFLRKMVNLREEFSMVEGTPEARSIQSDMSRTYVDYYRKAVSYVLAHPYSLTVVPVLYQMVDEGFPVFNQATDALHFRRAADSLATVYPESRYVKALAHEAERREKAMAIGQQILDAGEVGFVDFELPDLTGKRVKLSEVDAKSKVVLLYFWATTDEMKMFNLDQLLPLYQRYHDRGLEILAVSLDVDKTAWATVVRNQNVPWINLCDTRGNASPLIGFYGITSLPRIVMLSKGEVVTDNTVTDDASMDRFLAGLLK